MKIFFPKEEVYLSQRGSTTAARTISKLFSVVALTVFFFLASTTTSFFKVILSNYGVSNVLFNAVLIIQNASILVL